jgi:hypothetical protein
MKLCTAPRCPGRALFSIHGMIGGRYEAMCIDHALAHAQAALEVAQARVLALEEIGKDQESWL